MIQFVFGPSLGAQALDIAQIKDGFLITTFRTGKVYLSYQGAMEDASGDLLVFRSTIFVMNTMSML